jgi:diguanylate cyclase
MTSAKKPQNELARLKALYDLEILDTPPEGELDVLVQTAALVCKTPIAAISLVDDKRQWFKASTGLGNTTETSRDVAFCAHTILENDILEVNDASQHDVFADNTLVLNEPKIRFYAGVPLTLSDGNNIGSLCVIDKKPKKLNQTQQEILKKLAIAAVKLIEANETIKKLKHTEFLLSEKENLLNQSGMLANVGGWSFDLINNEISWSEQTSKIHNMPFDYQPKLDEALDFYTPVSKVIIQKTVENAIKTGDTWDLELQITPKGNKPIWIRTVGFAEFNKETNTPVKLYGAIQDIDNAVHNRMALERSNMRINLANKSANIGIWELDVTTNTFEWDAQMYELYGLTPFSVSSSYELWRNSIHHDDREETEDALKKALNGGDDFDIEFRIVYSDNTIKYIHGTAEMHYNELGQLVSAIGVNIDVTERRILANKLSDQYELMRVTLDSIADAVITTDTKGNITWLNPVAERMTGWLNKEAKSRPIKQVFHILHQETRKPVINPVLDCIENNSISGLEEKTILISKDGVEYGIEDSVAPIYDKNHSIVGTVLVFHDVTEQRKITEEITYKASHDQLTGLLNRSEFELKLTNILESSRLNYNLHSLMYIDLDQFKLVNDACGHAAGDLLLKQVTKILEDTARKGDSIARLGGDEFAIILTDCAVEHAQRVAQSICDKIDEFRFIHDGKRFRIGASIGLTPIDKRWNNISQVLQAADASCYTAKEAGRNRVHAWIETDLKIMQRQGDMHWASRIEHAMETNQFALFAQHIASNHNETGVHAEVLLRLVEKDGKIIMPNAFIPAAERYHLAARLDKWVLKKTIEWLDSQQNLSKIALITVNISGESISDRAFHNDACNLFKKAGEKLCNKLCIEITETVAIANIADANLFIDQVHDLGIKVALDDFGAGASSFGYLKSMKVDILKIDGQYIKNMITDELDDSAVRCFIDIAKILNMKTVAEFVENEEILKHVKSLGIDYAQGYLIHKPEPIDRILVIDNQYLINKSLIQQLSTLS